MDCSSVTVFMWKNKYRWSRLLRGASISKEVEQRLEVVARRQVVHQRGPEAECRSVRSHSRSSKVMKFNLNAGPY